MPDLVSRSVPSGEVTKNVAPDAPARVRHARWQREIKISPQTLGRVGALSLQRFACGLRRGVDKECARIPRSGAGDTSLHVV